MGISWIPRRKQASPMVVEDLQSLRSLFWIQEDYDMLWCIGASILSRFARNKPM